MSTETEKLGRLSVAFMTNITKNMEKATETLPLFLYKDDKRHENKANRSLFCLTIH